MKYRILFFVSFFIYPVTTFGFTLLHNRFGQTYTYNTVFTFMNIFATFSSMLLFSLALKKSLEEAALSEELSVLEQSKKIQEQQDSELNILKKEAAEKKSEFDTQLKKLLKLIQTGNTDEAHQYVLELTGSDLPVSSQKFCRDPFIDLILRTKKEEADRLGILIQYNVDLPPAGSANTLTYPELSSLFFNLLGNGIESCASADSSAPFLTFKVSWQSEILQIYMENSKNNMIKFNGDTTKEEKELHGLGLKIIEQIARDHNGYCEWLDKGSSFVSRVVMNYTSV